jgi:hypothetical protein
MSCAMASGIDVKPRGGRGVQRDLSRRTAVDHAIGRDFGITGGDVKEAGTVRCGGEDEQPVSRAAP